VAQPGDLRHRRRETQPRSQVATVVSPQGDSAAIDTVVRVGIRRALPSTDDRAQGVAADGSQRSGTWTLRVSPQGQRTRARHAGAPRGPNARRTGWHGGSRARAYPSVEGRCSQTAVGRTTVAEQRVLARADRSARQPRSWTITGLPGARTAPRGTTPTRRAQRLPAARNRALDAVRAQRPCCATSDIRTQRSTRGRSSIS
jgi:hypothetical protein